MSLKFIVKTGRFAPFRFSFKTIVFANGLACLTPVLEKIPIGTRKNSYGLHTKSAILPLECLRGYAVVAASRF